MAQTDYKPLISYNAKNPYSNPTNGPHNMIGAP